MREFRQSGSVEGVMGNHGSYSDFPSVLRFCDPFGLLARGPECVNDSKVQQIYFDVYSVRGL